MNLLREQDPRFANIERKVGLFILLAAAALAVGIAFIGARQGIFTPRTRILLYDQSGKDLKEGTAVEIRGFIVGQVSRITLNEDGKVEAELTINDSYMKWVRTDSVAHLSKEMFIGDSRISITPGSPQQEALRAGDVIPLERPPELIEVAKGVMGEVKPVLLQIKTFIEYIDDPAGDVKMTLANVNRLTAELVRTNERLDGLALQVESEIIPRVQTLLDSGTVTADEAGEAVKTLERFVESDLRGVSDSLNGQVIPELRALFSRTEGTLADTGSAVRTVEEALPGLVEKAERVLESVRVLADNLAVASQDAPAVAKEGGELIEESRDLVRRTRDLWPFREKISPQAEETIDVDSYQRLP